MERKMRRSEVYKSLLTDVFEKMHANNNIDDDSYNDVCDYISSSRFENIDYDNVPSPYKTIVKAIVDWDGSNDIAINVGDKVYYETAADEQLDYYRELSIFFDSSKYVLISVANLYDDIQANKVNAFLLNVEFIWAAISGNSDAKKEFWDRCDVKQENSFYIITDENLSSKEEIWNAYSYGYMLYANSKEYERNSQLNYNKEKKFAITIPYNKENMYSQYYELFDLISESHYCDDVLRRYLNMYQIIENMCYRRNLAKISRGSKRGFVRHSIAIASKANKNETDEIVKGIMDLFPNIQNVIVKADINPYDSFLEREYGIANVGHSDKKVAKIVYNLRNSIVHNKSTELHFSYGNFDEYKDVIGLIRKLIEKLEPKIIEIINDPSNNILEYDDKKMDLY